MSFFPQQVLSALTVPSDTTKADLKIKLKEDEHQAKENRELPIHEISAMSCLALGLLIEESQYVLRLCVLVKGSFV